MLKFIKDNIITTSDEVNKKYPNSQFLLGNCRLINGKAVGELLCIGNKDVDEEVQDLINEAIPNSKLYKNIGIFDYIDRGNTLYNEVFYKI